MKMKLKLLYSGFAVLLATSFTSCEKWLDVTASNQIKAEDLFETPGGYRDALLGVYLNMTNTSGYGQDMTWNLVDLLSQQYATLNVGAVYADLQQYNYRTARAVNVIDPIWNNQYKVIANINNILKHLDESDGLLSHIERSIIKGELLALRAFVHFDLIRLFGHGDYANRSDLATKPTIPYVTEFTKDATPQRSYQQTFELIESDLGEALELLKEDPVYPNASRPDNYYVEANRNGFYNDREYRMNYFAVRALQARVLLWQGRPDKKAAAAQAAEEVIEHSFARLLNGIPPNSSNYTLREENLFGLNAEQLPTILPPFLDADDNLNLNALFIPNAIAEGTFETANPNIGVADIRFNTLLANRSRGRISVKLASFTGSVQNMRLPLIKLPEMYYIAAEYYIEHDPGKAIAYLNMVRASRGIREDIPAGLEAEAIRVELLKEYRKEFISEGQLFFCYKRLGLESIPNYNTSVTIGDAIYILPYPVSETEFGNRVQF